jgi:hypothetical protein
MGTVSTPHMEFQSVHTLTTEYILATLKHSLMGDTFVRMCSRLWYDWAAPQDVWHLCLLLHTLGFHWMIRIPRRSPQYQTPYSEHTLTQNCFFQLLEVRPVLFSVVFTHGHIGQLPGPHVHKDICLYIYQGPTYIRTYAYIYARAPRT